MLQSVGPLPSRRLASSTDTVVDSLRKKTSSVVGVEVGLAWGGLAWLGLAWLRLAWLGLDFDLL